VDFFGDCGCGLVFYGCVEAILHIFLRSVANVDMFVYDCVVNKKIK